MSVIGIANSVELFRGELNILKVGDIKADTEILQRSAYITKNELKLLFKPYSREELAQILFNLYREHLRDFVNQRRKFSLLIQDQPRRKSVNPKHAPSEEESKLSAVEEFKRLEEYQLVHPKAFMMAAGKIDKLSGDIRVCFEILRSTV